MAKFTSNVTFRDLLDEVAFTAKVGEEYLLTQYGSFGSAPQVEIAYLTKAGPMMYEVPVTGGPETFPFTSGCTYDATVAYYAAFTDVTVYDSETLENVLCTIPEGAALPRDMNSNAGYSAVTLGFRGPQTYSVMLNAFSSMCGGATEGYISVPETPVLDMTTWLVPLQDILKGQ